MCSRNVPQTALERRSFDTCIYLPSTDCLHIRHWSHRKLPMCQRRPLHTCTFWPTNCSHTQQKHGHWNDVMMTSPNRNSFRVTGNLCGESTGALMLSLICAWINGWVNTGEAGDLRRHRAHYDVTDVRQIKPHLCTYPEGQHWARNDFLTASY